MAAETSAPNSDAHFITIDDVISPEQLLRTKERFVAAFLLHNGRNNEETSALFNMYSASSGETRAMCAALEEHLGASFGGPFMAAHESFVNSAARTHKHQVLNEAALRSLDSSSGEKLRRINVLKNVSLVFFTAAAAISAGMAALNAPRRQEEAAGTPSAAAALVFGALGGWFHSRLKKRESAEEKQREIIGLMILGAKIAIDGLTSILLCASDMESTSKNIDIEESTSKNIDIEEESIFEVRKKMAALRMKFQELQSNYRGDTRYSREFVLDRIIKHFNYCNY